MVEKKVVKKKVTKTTKPVAKKTEKKVKVAKAVISKANEETKYPIRGIILDGVVKSAKAKRTVTVERQLTHYIHKYERYKKVYSKIKAHVPEGMIVKEGDKVRIGETRKISKTKNFVIIEVLGEKKWEQWAFQTTKL